MIKDVMMKGCYEKCMIRGFNIIRGCYDKGMLWKSYDKGCNDGGVLW